MKYINYQQFLGIKTKGAEKIDKKGKSAKQTGAGNS